MSSYLYKGGTRMMEPERRAKPGGDDRRESWLDIRERAYDVFSSSESYFLTFKSQNKKHTLDFVRKLCSKVSNTYLICREANKQNDGYHYHAIIKKQDVIAEKWFVKGVHMRVYKVGDRKPFLGPKVYGDRCLYEMFEEEIREHMPYIEEEVINRKVVNGTYRVQRDRHTERVVDYITKEQGDQSLLYIDYTFIVKGKQHKHAAPVDLLDSDTHPRAATPE